MSRKKPRTGRKKKPVQAAEPAPAERKQGFARSFAQMIFIVVGGTFFALRQYYQFPMYPRAMLSPNRSPPANSDSATGDQIVFS